ncbi:MAG: hypothetical protein ACKN9X_01700, partial [Candidatus Methylopumilus sp.]
MSVTTHHGIDVGSTQFPYAAKDVWEVEAMVSKYNEISTPFMSANSDDLAATTHTLLRPVGAVKKRINTVLNSITRMIGDRDDDNDTLAAYVMLYEHIGSSQLPPITPSDLTTRVWDIINHKKAWKDIAARKNVEKLLREFNFPAPPERPMPDGPKVTVKAGPVDQGPGGKGPLPGPRGAGPLPGP